MLNVALSFYICLLTYLPLLNKGSEKNGKDRS